MPKCIFNKIYQFEEKNFFRAKRALCDKNLIIKLSTFTEHSLSLKKSALIGNSFTNKHRNNFFYLKIYFSKILNFKANFLNLTKCHIRPFSLWTHDFNRKWLQIKALRMWQKWRRLAITFIDFETAMYISLNMRP